MHWKHPWLSTPSERLETHGAAFVRYSTGKMRLIYNCLLPDGSRGMVEASFIEVVPRGGQPTLWRHRLASGFYQYGRVVITENVGVAFVADEALRPRRSPPHPDERFVIDLLADARIRQRVQDLEFATELYSALCRDSWVRRDGPETWEMSNRAAAAFVAELRDRGEEYIDFFLTGDVDMTTTEVEAELARLGWFAE